MKTKVHILSCFAIAQTNVPLLKHLIPQAVPALCTED